MKQLIKILAPLALLAACGGNNAAGTYVLDKEALFKHPMFTAMPDAKKGMESMAMEASLRADGTCSLEMTLPAVAGGHKQTASGTYSIDGDKLTIKTLEEDGKKVTAAEEKTGTIKDGVITISERGLELRLVKK